MSAFLEWLKRPLDNQHLRHAWVKARLAEIPSGALILDAGCGSQRYRGACAHLRYEAQDFGQYSTDEAGSFAASSDPYAYGPLDYTSDIWKIPVADGRFDALLCTEVFEHIPYPIAAVAEFGRILRPGGRLLLTLPCNCLRHMDPYFFHAGFSDRWLERVLPENGFRILSIEPVGDYHSWMAVELARSCLRHPWAAPLLLPALGVFWLLSLRPSAQSRATLCEGYHVVAERT